MQDRIKSMGMLICFSAWAKKARPASTLPRWIRNLHFEAAKARKVFEALDVHIRRSQCDDYNQYLQRQAVVLRQAADAGQPSILYRTVKLLKKEGAEGATTCHLREW